MNRGIATPIAADKDHSGVVQIGLEICKLNACHAIKPCMPATIMPNKKVTMMASLGQNTRLIKNVRIMLKTSASCDSKDRIICIAKGKRTPANIAAAIDWGKNRIRRSNQPERPIKVSNTEHNRNAPMASAMGTPAKLVTRMAAPGVDHAVSMGCLKNRERPMVDNPIPKPKAQNQLVTMASLAPVLLAA